MIPAAAAAAKSLQSCPTLCDPIDGSPPGSAVPGILQARTLEWVAISFSSAWKWKVKVKLLSHVRLLATPWTAAHQAPQSMGSSRQEYWSGVPLPSPKWSLQCLINMSPYRVKNFSFLWWQCSRSTRLATFKYAIRYINYSHHTVHCIPLAYFITSNLYLFIPFTHFTHTPTPASINHKSVFCIYELGVFLLLFLALF